MKQVKTLLLVSMSMLFTACGGGGSSSDGGTVPGTSETEQSIAINTIEAYAEDNTTSTPTVQVYIDAGVTGVDTENLEAVNTAIDVLGGTEVDTVSEIQAVVDTVNTPVADAGADQNVLTSATITLDGSGSSDINKDTLTYSWSFTDMPAESNALLSDDTAVSPTFIADVPGTYVLSLVVNDGTFDSNTDSITITVTTIEGILDTSFGTDGIVLSDNAAGGNNTDSGLSSALDSSGNIYVAGHSRNSTGNLDMVIWKYTSDGILDTTFGSDGIIVDNNAAGGNGNDWGRSIALDSSGNIYVAGYSRNSSGNDDMVIWKYTSEGVLDTTFGKDGIVVHNNAAGGNNTDNAFSIVLDSFSGNVYVTGCSWNGTNFDMVIWKYTSDGTLDTTFGTDGIVVYDNGFGDYGYSIVLDSSVNIYIAGYSRDSSGNDDMVIWKYTSDGVLDTTFGTDGIVVHNNAAGGNGQDYGSSIVLDSSDNVYVTGYSSNGTDFDMVIWKYTSDGVLDTTFGTHGIVVNDIAADYGYSITLDSLDNVYVTGYSFNGANPDMVIWKYTNNGTLDTTFGTDGIVVHNNAAGGNNTDGGWSIVLDSSGNVYVTGLSWNGIDFDMVIWKYK